MNFKLMQAAKDEEGDENSDDQEFELPALSHEQQAKLDSDNARLRGISHTDLVSGKRIDTKMPTAALRSRRNPISEKDLSNIQAGIASMGKDNNPKVPDPKKTSAKETRSTTRRG